MRNFLKPFVLLVLLVLFVRCDDDTTTTTEEEKTTELDSQVTADLKEASAKLAQINFASSRASKQVDLGAGAPGGKNKASELCSSVKGEVTEDFTFSGETYSTKITYYNLKDELISECDVFTLFSTQPTDGEIGFRTEEAVTSAVGNVTSEFVSSSTQKYTFAGGIMQSIAISRSFSGSFSVDGFTLYQEPFSRDEVFDPNNPVDPEFDPDDFSQKLHFTIESRKYTFTIGIPTTEEEALAAQEKSFSTSIYTEGSNESVGTITFTEVSQNNIKIEILDLNGNKL